MKVLWKNKRTLGQTTVEYLFLIFALVVIFTSIGQRIKAYLVGAGAGCPDGSFLCRVIQKYQGPGYFDEKGRYQWFSLMRSRT